MVHHGMHPTDPVRYYLAYMTEREIDERRQEQANADNDIEMINDGR